MAIFDNVNNQMFSPEFNQEHMLDNGFKLHTYVTRSVNSDVHMVNVDVYSPTNDKAGSFQFERKPNLLRTEVHLEAYKIWTEPLYRGLGLAPKVYQYMEALGNRMQPSNIQTSAGKALWTSMRINGDLSMKSLGYMSTAMARLKDTLIPKSYTNLDKKNTTHSLEKICWTKLAEFTESPDQDKYDAFVELCTKLNDGKPLLTDAFFKDTRTCSNKYITPSFMAALCSSKFSDAKESMTKNLTLKQTSCSLSEFDI